MVVDGALLGCGTCKAGSLLAVKILAIGDAVCCGA
jgi:hypothetical protein